MVILFESLISSDNSLTCTGVQGVSNITSCTGEDNFLKDDKFYHKILVRGTFDSSGT